MEEESIQILYPTFIDLAIPDGPTHKRALISSYKPVAQSREESVEKAISFLLLQTHALSPGDP
jgi:hypothetical protein